jgi:hypothetical protein
VANMIFPNQIVLGTASISHWWAMYHSMFKLTVSPLCYAPSHRLRVEK